MINIYISRGNEIKDSLLLDLIKHLKTINIGEITPRFHNRDDAYNGDVLRRCDTTIVLVENFHKIGKGVWNEIQESKRLGRKVVVAYFRKTDETFQFYGFNLGTQFSSDWCNYCIIDCGSNVTYSHIKYLQSLHKNSEKFEPGTFTDANHIQQVYEKTGQIVIDNSTSLFEPNRIDIDSFNSYTLLLTRRRRLR